MSLLSFGNSQISSTENTAQFIHSILEPEMSSENGSKMTKLLNEREMKKLRALCFDMRQCLGHQFNSHKASQQHEEAIN